MPERILICGADGYIGTALSRYLQFQQYPYDVHLADNYNRREWVKEVHGCSLTDYEVANKHNRDFEEIDLTDYLSVISYLKEIKPTVIVHLASQPSGPYSEISPYHRVITQCDNLEMLMNLMCSCNELKLSPKFIVTTTTGIPGAPKGAIEEEPMAIQAGSSYHASRGFDSANLSLAAKQFKFRILELRMAIVYGVTQKILGKETPVTRMDWDYYFGTVIHRFILLKRKGMSIKIYGRGEQKKPVICLKDVVKSLYNAISSNIEVGHEIMNQVTECLRVIDVARMINGPIEHIPNPRVEKEDYEMVIHNSKFMNLIHNEYTSLDKELPFIETNLILNRLPSDWEKIFHPSKTK